MASSLPKRKTRTLRSFVKVTRGEANRATVHQVKRLGVFVSCAREDTLASLHSVETIDMYFYNKPLEDDPSYPLHITLVIEGGNFMYSAYTDLMKIIDPAVVQLEVLHRNKVDWVSLDALTVLDSSFWKGQYGGNDHFLIMRCADHGLIDKKCIGLPELLTETFLQEYFESLMNKAVVPEKNIIWELDDDAGKMTWDIEGLLVKPSWHLAKYPYNHAHRGY